MFQNAGEKGILHPDPLDPPRRRANNRRGHGTFENDRPPVVGTIGRDSGEVRLSVVHRTDGKTLMTKVEATSQKGTTVNTDEWSGYSGVAASGRTHKAVNHSAGKSEWARDDDGDGIREVHTNTQEGFWTGLRNYLRIFRGVSKYYLHQYIATYQLIHNEMSIFASQTLPLALGIMRKAT